MAHGVYAKPFYAILPPAFFFEFNQFLKFSYDQHNLMLFDSIFSVKYLCTSFAFLLFIFVFFGFGLGFDLYDTVVV